MFQWQERILPEYDAYSDLNVADLHLPEYEDNYCDIEVRSSTDFYQLFGLRIFLERCLAAHKSVFPLKGYSYPFGSIAHSKWRKRLVKASRQRNAESEFLQIVRSLNHYYFVCGEATIDVLAASYRVSVLWEKKIGS